MNETGTTAGGAKPDPAAKAAAATPARAADPAPATSAPASFEEAWAFAQDLDDRTAQAQNTLQVVTESANEAVASATDELNDLAGQTTNAYSVALDFLEKRVAASAVKGGAFSKLLAAAGLICLLVCCCTGCGVSHRVDRIESIKDHQVETNKLLVDLIGETRDLHSLLGRGLFVATSCGQQPRLEVHEQQMRSLADRFAQQGNQVAQQISAIEVTLAKKTGCQCPPQASAVTTARPLVKRGQNHCRHVCNKSVLATSSYTPGQFATGGPARRVLFSPNGPLRRFLMNRALRIFDDLTRIPQPPH